MAGCREQSAAGEQLSQVEEGELAVPAERLVAPLPIKEHRHIVLPCRTHHAPLCIETHAREGFVLVPVQLVKQFTGLVLGRKDLDGIGRARGIDDVDPLLLIEPGILEAA